MTCLVNQTAYREVNGTGQVPREARTPAVSFVAGYERRGYSLLMWMRLIWKRMKY